MATRDGSLGSMLQGVSQQPPEVRPNGKVAEQINHQSDVVKGLTSRPALHERALIPNNPITDYQFLDVNISDTRYIVGYKPGALAVWDTDGAEQTVVIEGTALDYLGNDMRPYVFEDTLYLANRETVVAAGTTTDTTGIRTNVAVVTVLGGLYSRTYSATVRFDDGSVAEGTYTTPDGDTLGDADKTSSSNIALEVMTSLVNHANFKAGVNFARDKGVFFVRDPAAPITVTVDDDDTQTAMRVHTQTADKVEDLARTAPHGTLVRITGDDAGTEDDFYLRFNSAITETPGLGFGSEGVWEEWVNPHEVVDFDLTTMPHLLDKTGPAEFTLKQGEWRSRRVGDEESNPFPDFVGYPIRDIGGFQSRLVFVAGPWCAMSRTNKPNDFFKQSALTNLVTDPISVSSTQEGTVRLDWIIPFDRDLVLMSDPGEGQFIITGANKITPDNASLVRTTAFEIRGGTKPVETGRTILFPFNSGIYSGIKEFFTNDEVTTNGADDITETVDRYIVGTVNKMKCSTNFSMAGFTTSAAGFENTLWVYKYLWQNTEKLQSSWSKWVFPAAIRHFFFKGSDLFVVMAEEGYTGGTTNYIFAALDLGTPVDDTAGYHICVDRQLTRVADAGNLVSLPYEGAAFVQGVGCTTPGSPVQAALETATASGADYTFDAAIVPVGATVIGGLRYTRSLTPTMPYIRDRNGEVAPRTALVVNGFILEYEDTGYLKAVMKSRYRQDDIEFEVDWFPLDNDPGDPLGNGLRTGKQHIPWGERSDWSDLTLTSDDVRPTTYIELEWVGQSFKGSRG